MSDFIRTSQAEAAYQMCELVMTTRQYSRAGQITGDPGTGKSTMTKWLEGQFNAVRIECWPGMGDKHLLQAIILAFNRRFGTNMSDMGTSNTLFMRLVDAGLDGRLIIVDEASQLRWRPLDILRALSDRDAGVVIAGTDQLARTFSHPQIRHFLDQFRQRIGAKKILMQPIAEADELAAYVLVPRFPSLTKTGAKRFHEHSGGNWRTALELADACARLMENESLPKLDERVVETAAAWMAGHS